MGLTNINVSANAKPNEQLVVNAQNFEIRIGENRENADLDAPCPVEYILAGLAGCLNIVGGIVAKELNIEIESLKISISGDLNTDKYLGLGSKERAGFQKIEVNVQPVSNASSEAINEWIEIVESRCPVQDNLLNATPISLKLERQPKEPALA